MIATQLVTSFPDIYWKRRPIYRAHNSLQLDSVMLDLNPIRNLKSHFCNTHFNITFPFTAKYTPPPTSSFKISYRMFPRTSRLHTRHVSRRTYPKYLVTSTALWSVTFTTCYYGLRHLLHVHIFCSLYSHEQPKCLLFSYCDGPNCTAPQSNQSYYFYILTLWFAVADAYTWHWTKQQQEFSQLHFSFHATSDVLAAVDYKEACSFHTWPRVVWH